MNVLHILKDEKVKKVIIEKEEVTSQTSSKNEKLLNMNISIRIVYDDDNDNQTVVQGITVGDYILKWLYEIKSNDLKSSSFDRKEQTILHQIIPYIGDIPLNRLSFEDVQGLINTLKNKYSYSTVKKAYEAINGCMKYAMKTKDIQQNPAEYVVLLKNMKRQLEDICFFSYEEAEKIKEEAVSCYKNGKRVYRLGEIVIFLLNTGLRIGEALALKWSDIDFEKKIVNVRKNVVFVKKRSDSSMKRTSGYQWKEQDSTKTHSGSRVVPLNSEAIRALFSLKVINGKNDLVFSNANGNRVYARNIDRMFRAILKRCGIRSAGVHSLRHTFASRLFERGVDVKTVSTLLGHSEVGITYNTYIHIIQEQQITAVEVLENVL